MTVSEAKHKIPVSEALAWAMKTRDEWNEHSKLDHYITRLAYTVYMIPYRLFGGNPDKTEDEFFKEFFLKFTSDGVPARGPGDADKEEPGVIKPRTESGNMRVRDKDVVRADYPNDESPEALEKRKKAALMKAAHLKGTLLSALKINPATGRTEGKVNTRKPPDIPANRPKPKEGKK